MPKPSLKISMKTDMMNCKSRGEEMTLLSMIMALGTKIMEGKFGKWETELKENKEGWSR